MINNVKLLELLEAYKFEELTAALKENAREEIEKASGTSKSENSIIKNFLKYATKNSNNKALGKQHSFTYNGNEYNAIIDGHRILAKIGTFNIESAEDHEKFKVSQMFNVGTTEELKINIKDAKFFTKEHKITGNKKITEPYILEYNNKKIGVNPLYLTDALEFCQTDTIHFNTITNNYLKSPILVYSDNLEKMALVLPVNIID